MIVGQDPSIPDNEIYTYENDTWGLSYTGYPIQNLSFNGNSLNNSISASTTDQNVVYYMSGNSIFTSNPLKPWINAVQSNDGTYKYCINNIEKIVYNVATDGSYTTTIINNTDLFTLTDIYCSSSGQYVAISTNGGQIYVSTNYGNTYTAYEATNNWYNIFISDNGQVLYSTDINNILYQSTNGGVTCIAFGTYVLMEDGTEKQIQELKINDIVKTWNGVKKIIYIGFNKTKKYKENFKCIKKDAFKDNVPNKDLYISNGHTIFINNEDYKKSFFENYDTYSITNVNNINNSNNYKSSLICNCKLAFDIEDNLDEIIYFHIVFENNENDNKNTQDAFYANGLLVESMSENYIRSSNLNKYLYN